MKVTSRQRERSDYMRFLVVTSVIYYNIENNTTPEMQELTRSFLADGKEHTMPSILNDQYLHISDDTIAERAATPYEYFINNHSLRFIMYTAFDKKANRRQKQCYFVMGFIIQKYTTTLKNEDVKKFSTLYMSRISDSRNKKGKPKGKKNLRHQRNRKGQTILRVTYPRINQRLMSRL